VAWGSAHVVAWESAHVVARESVHVVARESAHVVASNEVVIHNHSISSTIEIAGYAIIMAIKVSKFLKKSKTATIINIPERQYTVEEWFDREAVDSENGKLIVYKRVSFDFKTQENSKNETLWAPNSMIEHPSWDPAKEECGAGKFHACSRAYFCDEFRDKATDKYIAIEVNKEDFYTWKEPSYPHKIAFRKGRVLFECDRYGKKIDPK
jgi:hypothetical protein